MLFRTYRPSAPLSHFVDIFWFFSGGDLPHSRERVLPDGSAELVINLDEVPRKRFDRADPRRFQTVRRAWISGAQPEFMLIDVLPRANMIGVHFKPGGLAPFIAMPVSELSGELVELDLLWHSAADELREQLLNAPNLQARFKCLEDYLIRCAHRSLSPDPLIVEAVQVFLRGATVPAIAHVAESMGLSHKHFIDRFRATVGLSPKRFCRIRRFQRALGDLRARRDVDWADVAAAGGYYDQAHFIHDFRAFSGLTPTRYLGQFGADDRFVPVTD